MNFSLRKSICSSKLSCLSIPIWIPESRQIIFRSIGWSFKLTVKRFTFFVLHLLKINVFIQPAFSVSLFCFNHCVVLFKANWCSACIIFFLWVHVLITVSSAYRLDLLFLGLSRYQKREIGKAVDQENIFEEPQNKLILLLSLQI